MTLERSVSKDVSTVDGWNVTHQCRNWSSLLAFTESHVTLSERFLIGMPSSRPWAGRIASYYRRLALWSRENWDNVAVEIPKLSAGLAVLSWGWSRQALQNSGMPESIWIANNGCRKPTVLSNPFDKESSLKPVCNHLNWLVFLYRDGPTSRSNTRPFRNHTSLTFVTSSPSGNFTLKQNP